MYKKHTVMKKKSFNKEHRQIRPLLIGANFYTFNIQVVNNVITSSFLFLQDDPGADKENSLLPPSGGVPSTKASEDNVIDNPYLRPVKKPKVRRKK